LQQKYAITVKKITKITKISIGLAELISRNGQVKCGGVVEKVQKMRLDVNLGNIQLKRKKRRTKIIIMAVRPISLLDACVAKNLVTE
jgi:hypothetical protein